MGEGNRGREEKGFRLPEAALDQNLSEAVAAIQTLLKFIKNCKPSSPIMGLNMFAQLC